MSLGSPMMPLVRSAMCSLYPPEGALPGIEETDIDAFLVRFRSEANSTLWLGVVLGTLVFTLTPLLTLGLPLPSFMLNRQLRDRHAAKITVHPMYLIRQAVMILKTMAGLCWGAHPKIRDAIQLPPYLEDPGTWRSS